jgi:hypothetical protein
MILTRDLSSRKQRGPLAEINLKKSTTHRFLPPSRPGLPFFAMSQSWSPKTSVQIYFLRLTPFLTQAYFLLLCRKTSIWRIGSAQGNLGSGGSLRDLLLSETQAAIITFPQRSGGTSSSLGFPSQRLLLPAFQPCNSPLPPRPPLLA